MRPFWTDAETSDLLDIFHQKKVMNLFDGKRFRNSEIFKMISNEILKRGHTDRDDKQVEYRWKNLRKNYIAAKKNNNKSGAARATCKYYDELDRILGDRPTSTCITNKGGFEGIDASEDTTPRPCTSREAAAMDSQKSTNLVEQEEEGQPEVEPPAKKIKSKEKGSYARSLDKLAEKLIKTQKDISEEIFKKQKELADYEFNLYKNFELREREAHAKQTKEIIESTMDKFFNRMELMFNKHSSPPNMTPSQQLRQTQSSSLAVSTTDEHPPMPQVDEISLPDFIQTWNDDE